MNIEKKRIIMNEAVVKFLYQQMAWQNITDTPLHLFGYDFLFYQHVRLHYISDNDYRLTRGSASLSAMISSVGISRG